MRNLRKSWRNCRDPVQQEQLRTEWHGARKMLRKVIQAQRRHEELRQKIRHHQMFRADPFQYCKKYVEPRTAHIDPSFSSEDCKNYFVRVYHDPQRGCPYELPSWLPPLSQPIHLMSMEEPSFAEYESVVHRARTKSAPGPNGLQYVVYKRCPLLRKKLFPILCRVWKECAVPRAWQVAKIILAPKTTEGDDPSNFRPLALGNVEGKLFFALLQRRLTEYMLKNAFFQNQKGFLPKMAGCVEHSVLTAEAMKDAKKARRSLTLCWVDMANAFGSVRHSLIQFALEYFHVPNQVKQVVASYYSNLRAVVSTRAWSTDPIPYEIGVFQGCTASPVLFNIVMQLAIIALQQHAHLAYEFKEAPVKVLVAAFADDIELVTKSAEGNQRLLNTLCRFTQWTGCMRLKPEKCCAMSYAWKNKAFAACDPSLSIDGKPIKYIGGKDFKYLGRWLQVDGKEDLVRQRILDTLMTMCVTVDKLPLGGLCKLWIFQHYALPRVMWGLMVHDLCLAYVRMLDKKVKPFVKRWASLPRPANATFLFIGSKSHGGLRMRRIETIYKQMQVVRLDLIRHAADDQLRGIFQIIQTREATYRQRHAHTALLHEAQSDAKVVSALKSRRSRRGLGAWVRPEEEERKQITQAVLEIDRRQQLERVRKLSIQGRWAEWIDLMQQDFSWKRLIAEGNESMLLFALKATVNVLPTRDNLRRWGTSVLDARCPLCGWHSATLRHVLNGCKTALQQHRYTWRHDSILQEIANCVKAEVDRKPQAPEQGDYIQFVRAGEKACPRQRRSLVGTLQSAQDWTLLVDLPNGSLKVPEDVAVTILRPDLLLMSRALRHIIFVELTSPFEDRVLDAEMRKTSKYQLLVEQAALNGWQVQLYTVEVGSRGYVAPSLPRFLDAIDVPKPQVKHCVARCGKTALRCSYVIYLSRDVPEWYHGDLPVSPQMSLPESSSAVDAPPVLPSHSRPVHRLHLTCPPVPVPPVHLTCLPVQQHGPGPPAQPVPPTCFPPSHVM